jgi:Periplasmic copper-binding protein (NosD)
MLRKMILALSLVAAAGGAASAQSPGGSTGAVQFNNAGSFGGDTNNFFWDITNKRLGIGTSSPPLPVSISAANAQAWINRPSNAASNYALVDWATAGTTRFLMGLNSDGAGAGVDKLGIYDYANSPAAPTMTFTGGNVGIATMSPSFPLTVNKDGTVVSGNWYNVAQFDNGAASGGINLGYDNSNNYGIVASVFGGGLEFWTGSTPVERLRIDVSGGVSFAAASFASLELAGLSTSNSDNSSFINAALASSMVVVLPCGTFAVRNSITPSQAGQTLRGSGQGCTTIQMTNGALNSDIIDIAQVSDVTVSDLTIDGTNVALGECIRATGSFRTKIHRVSCVNLNVNLGIGFEQVASTTNGSDYSELGPCYIANISNTLSHSVEISLSHHVIVHDCTMTNVDNGVNVAGSNYAVVANNNIQGNGANSSGFAGVRCTDLSINLTATGNNIQSVPRGLFLLGCSNSTFTGNSILTTTGQGALIQATSVAGGSPTQLNTITGNTFTNNCTAGGCSGAIELNVNSVSASNVTGNIVTGNPIRDIFGTVTIGILNGVTTGTNACATNTANLTLGGC